MINFLKFADEVHKDLEVQYNDHAHDSIQIPLDAVWIIHPPVEHVTEYWYHDGFLKPPRESPVIIQIQRIVLVRITPMPYNKLPQLLERRR